jgi:deazaflavin-dependent oxidoreductase (nitroreductase family)
MPKAPQAESPVWWFWERFTDLHVAAYRLTRGRLGKNVAGPILLLDHVGAKTGKRRTSPLIYFTDDAGNWVIVASKGGIDKSPAWWHNLKAHPVTTAQVGGERRPVRAREAEGEERERLWKRAVEVYKPYESYQRRTKRRIPVIVLEPAPALR